MDAVNGAAGQRGRLRKSVWRRASCLIAAAVMGPAFGLALAPPASAAGAPLIGTFIITAGSCSGGVASGTYLRMVLPGGSNGAGPYFSNSASTCSDLSYTPLAPGAAGGLVTGSYQAQPGTPFDAAGNSLSDQITAPVAFEGVKFGTATNPTDPQTGLRTPVPTITANGSALSGDLAAFGVSWNNQEFNQGSPKPDGSSPGNTSPVAGTYNPATRAYVLQWSSQVVGGPFNGFSAFWNLTGRYVPVTSPAGGSTSPEPASSTGSPTPASQATAPGDGATPSVASAGSASTGSSAAPAAGHPPAAGTTASAGVAGERAGSSRHQGAVPRSLSVTTTISRPRGWRSPLWLVTLVAALGVLGLAGVLWSERSLRRLRPSAMATKGE
jgi:hypothetical protein